MPLFLLANWRWIAGGLLVLGAVLAYQHQISKAFDRGHAQAETEWKQKFKDAQDAAEKEAKRRDVELAKAVKGVNEDAKKRIAQASADSDRNRLAVIRLRDHISMLANASTNDPAAIPVGEATSRLAEVAGKCASEYQRLAENARAGLEAGKTCERQYQAVIDQLTPKEPK